MEMGFGSLGRRGSSLLILFSLLVSLVLGAFQGDDCPTAKCGPHGPDIRFPFRLKGGQPKHCGYPGFELSCKDGHTVLNLPTSSSENIFIKSISYSSQTLSVFNPNNCFAALFVDLNFLTPYRSSDQYIDCLHTNSSLSFQDALDYHAFLLFDCSLKEDVAEGNHQVPIPCMNSPGHSYLLVDSKIPLGEVRPSCTTVKTVCIPYKYLRDLFGGGVSPAISLSWDLPVCSHCESLGKACGFVNKSTKALRCYNELSYGKGKKNGNWSCSIRITVHTYIVLNL
ncbi:putative RING-H2 finger protein ATL21A [Macadamia integrifolia]|uniref:putative RING-H2 finger protein ATL21A n=1 Tax=Macadamia integrifolia TaxID=60698 RepID=UPI001C4FEE64|nr:putative RING-H2 finger protein ATL21A [Macadamia integrifolia]